MKICRRFGRARMFVCALVAVGFAFEGSGAGTPPVITAQPQPATAFVGGSFSLHVSAVSSNNLRYRWRLNGTNLPNSILGQSTPFLTITNARLSSAGQYSVVVSNSFGAVTSQTAVVTVNDVTGGIGLGYINFDAPPGYSLFALSLPNSLNPAITNSLYAIDGASLFKMDGTGFVANNFLDGWSDPHMPLTKGEGWFFHNPDTINYRLTEVGVVVGGWLTNRLPQGLCVCSSLLPQPGLLSDVLQFSCSPTCEVFRFDKISQSFARYTCIAGDWQPTQPTVEVGESFFVRQSVPTDWVRWFREEQDPTPFDASFTVTPPILASEIGELNFFTYNIDPFLGRVFDIDGATPVDSNFMGQLYAATSAGEESLTAIGAPAPFLSGPGAGYIRASSIKLPGITGGQTVLVQLRAWEKCAGDTYEEASANGSASGRSAVFEMVAHAVIENGMPGFPPRNANTFPTFQVGFGPAVPLRVARIQSVGATVEICFATRPGAIYCVQTSSQCGDAMTWNNLSGASAIAGTGHVAIVSDARSASARFYRVCRLN